MFSMIRMLFKDVDCIIMEMFIIKELYYSFGWTESISHLKCLSTLIANARIELRSFRSKKVLIFRAFDSS